MLYPRRSKGKVQNDRGKPRRCMAIPRFCFLRVAVGLAVWDEAHPAGSHFCFFGQGPMRTAILAAGSLFHNMRALKMQIRGTKLPI